MRVTMSRAVSAVACAAAVVVCVPTAGPARMISGLALIGAFAAAVWNVQRRRFDALVPTAGLILAFLILAGLALAAAHVLNPVPVALVTALATLAAAWFGASRPAHDSVRLKPRHTLAFAGALIFAVATVLAVRYCANSATADGNAASSIAVWAYPSGGRLHVGVGQAGGHGATVLRIVVTRAGSTVATWNDVRLAPGGTWQAPTLAMTGSGPTQVVALHGGTVVASMSSR